MREPEPQVAVVSDVQQEYRVTCASFGEIGHHDHHWIKDRYSLAVRYADKKAKDVQGTQMAQVELPFLIQTRVVSPWEKAFVVVEVKDESQRIDLDGSVGVGIDAGGISVERVEGTETVAGDSGAVWEGSEPGVTGVQADGDGEVDEHRPRFGTIGERYTSAADDAPAG